MDFINQHHLFQLANTVSLNLTCCFIIYSDIAGGKLHIYEGKQFVYLLLVSKIVLGISSGFDNTGYTTTGGAVDPSPLHKIPRSSMGDF